jgi:hypothetical protein
MKQKPMNDERLFLFFSPFGMSLVIIDHNGRYAVNPKSYEPELGVFADADHRVVNRNPEDQTNCRQLAVTVSIHLFATVCISCRTQNLPTPGTGLDPQAYNPTSQSGIECLLHTTRQVEHTCNSYSTG